MRFPFGRIEIFWLRIEGWLVGPLKSEVRTNMHWELISALGTGVFSAAISFIPVILRNLGASAAQLALFNIIGYIGFTLTGLSLVLLRSGRTKWFTSLCWFLGRGVYLLVAFVASIPGLLVISAVNFLFNSLSGPGYSKIIQAVYPIQQRGRVMSLVRIGMALAMIVATPICGWILDRFGFQIMLPAAAVLGSVAVLAFLRINFDESKLSQVNARPADYALRLLKQDRRMVLYLVSIILFGFGVLIPIFLFPIILVDRLKLSYSAIGALTFVQNLFWFAGYVWGGRLVDRLGGVRALELAFLVKAVSMLPFAFATTGWMLLPAFILGGLATAGSDLGFFNSLVEVSDPQHISETNALQSTVIGIRGLIAPLIGLWLFSAGASDKVIIILGVGLVFLSAGFLHWIWKSSPIKK